MDRKKRKQTNNTCLSHNHAGRQWPLCQVCPALKQESWRKIQWATTIALASFSPKIWILPSHCPEGVPRAKSAYLWTKWPQLGNIVLRTCWLQQPMCSFTIFSQINPCLPSLTFFFFLAFKWLPLHPTPMWLKPPFFFFNTFITTHWKTHSQFGKMDKKHFSLFLPLGTAKYPGHYI